MQRIFSKVVLSYLVSIASCLQVFGADSAPPKTICPVVILGGGMGGLTSALYLSRAEIATVVVEGNTSGGLITQSHSVQNWPTELEISGSDLAEKLRSQVKANGAFFLREEVVAVDFNKRPFEITLRAIGHKTSRTVLAHSVIIAMGSSPNHLGVPGETGQSGYWGKGVTNCAVCDGSLYRDKIVGVVGGGDGAVTEAMYLSNIAKKVYIFVRKNAFQVSEKARLKELLAKPNVQVIFSSMVQKIEGDGSQVTHVVLQMNKEKMQKVALDGLFLAIGSTPNTKLFKNVLELDKSGYIVLKKGQQTSVEGVYAIGDIADPVYKQAITAAGDGAKAAMQLQEYICKKGIKPVINSLQNVHSSETSSTELIEVSTRKQLEKEVQRTKLPIFVDFYAPWCGPCKQIGPRVEKSAKVLSGKVKFIKVNVDRDDQISDMYQIKVLPSAVLLDNEGNVLEKKNGPDQIYELLNRLETDDS